MDASNIRNLTRRIVEEKKADYQKIADKAGTLRRAIESANEKTASGFKQFAHTQLIQNASVYGRDVIELVKESSEAMRENKVSISNVQEQIVSIKATLAELNESLQVQRNLVADQLKTDTQFSDLKSALDLSANIRKTGQATYGMLLEEVSQKLPAYEKSKTLKSAFGTEAYARGGLIASFDKIIARKTQFNLNQESHSILLGIKAASNEALGDIESNYQNALEAYENYEVSAYDTPEITRLIGLIQEHESKLRNAQSELQKCVDVDGRHAAYTDSLSLEAKALVHKVLTRKDTYALADLAAATPSIDDDNALKIINRALDDIKMLTGQLDRVNTELKESELALNRAKDIKRTVDNDSRLSGDRYEYSSESKVMDLLTGYVIGSIASSDLVSNLKRHSEYVPPPSSSSSDYSFGSSGGGFSSSSSISSSSSGSFSTTDSF
jgi:hypothetical protein